MTDKKYYLLEDVKVIILEKSTKKLNKKGYVVIQGLACGSTARVKRTQLKKGGLLEDYFKNQS